MMNLYKTESRPFFCSVIILTIVAFLSTIVILPDKAYAQHFSGRLNLPTPGSMVALSPAYNPPVIRGITINPNNPLQIDFIVDVGDDDLEGSALTQESTKLIKYFLTALTVPEEKMWVNLSPYEKDRIIPDGLAQTDMGRDLLAQDYLLKQLTASLMYPEDVLGNHFWQRIHTIVLEKYGITEVPTNIFNKIWIVPEKATVYVNAQTAFITKHHLKVMLEEDYLALAQSDGLGNISKDQLTQTDNITAQVIRDVLIPEIEKEINQGQHFAPLRQIFNSVILATWYKNNLKEGLLAQKYIDQDKVTGLTIEEKNIHQKIYDRYIEAFKKGTYNYIKEEYDSTTQKIIPKKYFSGGVTAAVEVEESTDDLAAMSNDPNKLQIVQTNLERLSTDPDSIQKGQIFNFRNISPAIDIHVFDYDGTLQLSNLLIDKVELSIFTEFIYGQDASKKQKHEVENYIENNPVTLRELFKWALTKKNIHINEDNFENQFKEFIKKYRIAEERSFDTLVQTNTLLSQYPFIPSAQRLLEKLKRQNKPRYIATNFLESQRLRQNRILGLDKLIPEKHVFGGESKSFPPGKFSKIALLKRIAKKHNKPYSSIAIYEDSASTIRQAAKEGFITIGIAQDQESVKKFKEAGAHIVIYKDFRNYEHLLDLVSKKDVEQRTLEFLAPEWKSLVTSQEVFDAIGQLKSQIFESTAKRDGIKRYESTVALMEELRAQGYPINIASGSRSAKFLLEKAGVAHLIDMDQVVDGHSIRELGLKGKPHAGFFKTAAERIGINPEGSIVIEDQPDGVAAAKKDGFTVIALDREGKTDELLAENPDLILKNLDDFSLADLIALHHRIKGEDVPFEGVLFDNDGVIVESEPIHAASYKHAIDSYLEFRRQAFNETHAEFTLKEYYQHIVTKGTQAGLTNFFNARGIDIDSATLAQEFIDKHGFPEHWDKSWELPNNTDMLHAQEVLDTLGRPDQQQDPIFAMPQAGDSYKQQARTLRSIYFMNPDVAGILLLAVGYHSHNTWAQILQQDYLYQDANNFDTSFAEIKILADMLNRGIILTQTQHGVVKYRENTLTASQNLKDITTVLGNMGPSLSSPIVNGLNIKNLAPLLSAVIHFILTEDGISYDAIREDLLTIVKQIPEKKILQIQGLLEPRHRNFLLGKNKLVVPEQPPPPQVQNQIPRVSGKSTGTLTIIHEEKPNIDMLRRLPSDAIIALPYLPIMDMRVGPFKGILTFVEEGETSHAQKHARHWGIPHALWPGLETLKQYEEKEIEFEVTETQVNINLSDKNDSLPKLNEESQNRQQKIHFPEANLEGEEYYLEPTDPKLQQPQEVGYKIALKSQLAAQGLTVSNPKINVKVARGPVLSFKAFLHELKYARKLEALQRRLTELQDQSPYFDPWFALNGIEQLFKDLSYVYSLRSSLSDKIKHKLNKLSEEVVQSTGVFVRTSTNVESLPGHPSIGSGIYKTVPHVKSRKSLLEAIMLAWSSVWSEKAFWERRAHKIDESKVVPAIEFLPSVAAKYSFVMHTSYVAQNKPDKILIEVAQGLGEALVSSDPMFVGFPTTIVWDKSQKTPITQKQGTKKIRSVLAPGGGTLLESVDPKKTFLTHPDAQEVMKTLAEVAEQAENFFKGPQEIEGNMEFDQKTGEWTLTLVQTGFLTPQENYDTAALQQKTPGGVDMNPQNMNMELEGSEIEFNVPADPAYLQNIRIDGLVPVIINVIPVTSLNMLFGQSVSEKEQTLSKL